MSSRSARDSTLIVLFGIMGVFLILNNHSIAGGLTLGAAIAGFLMQGGSDD